MLRANRDATRQKDPKGFVVQTSSNEICRQLWKTRTENFEQKKKKKKNSTNHVILFGINLICIIFVYLFLFDLCFLNFVPHCHSISLSNHRLFTIG